MTISAMKQALEALDAYSWEQVDAARTALRQAIAEAEKQKPVAIGEEWKPCVKLPIVVHVREQRKGEAHVSTREGITPVKEDDLIMRGVAGEEYPISRELFNRTYTFDTAPVHAIDISQERVDETQKSVHENQKYPQESVDETPPCKTHPDAPHGFDRNASHSADRYVCECEGWEPPKEKSGG